MRRSGPGTLGPAESDDAEAHAFAEFVSVQVKAKGRDEFVAALTVRLKTDCAAHPRSLLVELTDEADLLFYYSLVLNEGDFHTLKAEQRLLIDFQSFPVRLAELLRRCTESVGSAAEGAGASGEGHMVARLDCSGSEGLLAVVECNQFRELTHIALRLRQGTDETVKQHLAEKLRGSRAEASDLRERLRASEEGLAQARRQVDELTARSRVVSEERTHLERSLEASRERELADLRQEHARTTAEAQRAASEERAKLEAGLTRSLSEALERATQAESANQELRQQRQALTAAEQGCREKLQAAEQQLRDARREAQSAREQQQQLELAKFQHERELGEARIQLSGAKDQLAAKEQLLANQAAQIEQASSQRRGLEDMLTTSKQQIQGLEEKFAISAQEIDKGNQIIQSLHSTSKQARAKLKIKASEFAHKEKAVMELQRAEELSRIAVEEKEHELARSREREEQMKGDAAELKKRLAEAHEVLRSNQEVIEFLNRQLTERDLKSLPLQCQSQGRSGSGEPLDSTVADILRRAEGAGRGLQGSATGGLGALGLGLGGAHAAQAPGGRMGSAGGAGGWEALGMGAGAMGLRPALQADTFAHSTAYTSAVSGLGLTASSAAHSATGPLGLTASSERGLLFGGGSSLAAGSPYGTEARDALLGPAAAPAAVG